MSSASSSAGPGDWANGFRTISDGGPLATFMVSEANVSPWSLPQEAFTFQPAPQLIVHQFKSGDQERKIHCNTVLREDEQSRLKDLQDASKKHNKVFYPCITVMATRYLSQARNDIDTALNFMQRTQDWRTSYFAKPLTDATMIEDLRLGIAYFTGRDCCLRPTLVFRAARIPAEWHKKKCYDRVVRIVVFCMEYLLRYMVIPGRVEGMNLVIDLAGMSVSMVPVSAIREMHKSMGCHYSGRVYRMYICNMSWVLKGLVSVAKTILTDRQAQKLMFIDNVDEFHKDFALHQLEKDLGGTRPVETTFFPFPLQPGPFDAGNKSGPDSSRVPRMHQALTYAGTRGRLWDTSKGVEDNTRLEYSPEAPELFKSAQLTLPSEIQRDGAGAAPERENGTAPTTAAVPPEPRTEVKHENPPINNRMPSMDLPVEPANGSRPVPQAAVAPLVVAQADSQSSSLANSHIHLEKFEDECMPSDHVINEDQTVEVKGDAQPIRKDAKDTRTAGGFFFNCCKPQVCGN